jgi:toxin ParE1/3/4
VKRTVRFSPESRADLLHPHHYIADRASNAIASRYVGRIVDHCLGFDMSAERGNRRDDLRPGLRIVGFERRVTIAFHVDAETVTIDRILYGGQDIERIFRDGA